MECLLCFCVCVCVCCADVGEAYQDVRGHLCEVQHLLGRVCFVFRAAEAFRPVMPTSVCVYLCVT